MRARYPGASNTALRKVLAGATLHNILNAIEEVYEMDPLIRNEILDALIWWEKMANGEQANNTVSNIMQ